MLRKNGFTEVSPERWEKPVKPPQKPSVWAMLLIAALAIILGRCLEPPGITGQLTLNRIEVFWNWAFGARV
jgi:hypothetical protein